MPTRRASRYFMYGKPKTAKRLYFDVIPKNVDEYHQQLARLRRAGRGGSGSPTRSGTSIAASRRRRTWWCSFAMLLNLASAANAARQGRALGLHPPATRRARRPETHPGLDAAAGYAVRYFEDFVRPAKTLPRRRTRKEAAALADLARPAGGRGTGRPIPRRCRHGLRGRQGARLRAAQGLVRGDLRGAARRGAGAALRRLHRALRHPGDGRADRRRRWPGGWSRRD